MKKLIDKDTEYFRLLVAGILFEQQRIKNKLEASFESIFIGFNYNPTAKIPLILKTIDTDEESKPNSDLSSAIVSGSIYIFQDNMAFIWSGPPAYIRLELDMIQKILADPDGSPSPWRLTAAYMNSYRAVPLSEFIRCLRISYPQLDVNNDNDFSIERAKVIGKGKTCCDHCQGKPIAGGNSTQLLLHCGHCQMAAYCSKDCQVCMFIMYKYV